MKKYISILRGINVGGKRKILMADLKKLYLENGFSNIITYIQSGNVIFDSDKKLSVIQNIIEEMIVKKYGFEVPVLIKTFEELEKVIKIQPFISEGIKSLHVTFLGDEPEEKLIKKIENIDYGKDRYKIIGKNVFIFCDGSYHKSKLTNNFFEKKLGVKATTRNWNTVNKIFELSK